MALLPVDEALKRLTENVQAGLSETVSIHQAGGRTLAAPMVAHYLQSPFDASAMDGYAVRANKDGSYPSQFRVIGEAAAGKRYLGQIAKGEAIRIFTGAPVPADADSVVIQENVTRNGDMIEVCGEIIKHKHIRRAGLDFKLGEELLPAGRKLDAAALALAAASGNAELQVTRRPRVAILATGDELVAPGKIPAEDQIISSNSSGIAELVRAQDATAIDLGIVPDQTDLIIAAIKRAMDDNVDVLVTLGGASVGDHDLVHKALTACGMELDFWKIAMRPGKPLMHGSLTAANGRIIHVLGLPGNPVSSMVCGYLFLLPLIAKLTGHSYRADIRKATLSIHMPENDHRRDYVRAEYILDDQGDLIVQPLPVQDSSMLGMLARANALIIREANAPAIDAGANCQILVLR
ncbi:molybdopterin molybdotransferase MoeA [Paenochrobactrum pullorum]|uniref:molybdopterin molybdotransferase MoeA n=1 Tax=Paenochrobactrum pullorum TaxID=1324351 RepID=UPI0035BBD125